MADNPYSASQHADHMADGNERRVRKVKRFNPIQTGKMLAVLYFIMSLLFLPFIFLIGMAGNSRGSAGISIGMAVLIPFFYAIAGFIGGIIIAWIYNLVAKFVGGLEVEIE